MKELRNLDGLERYIVEAHNGFEWVRVYKGIVWKTAQARKASAVRNPNYNAVKAWKRAEDGFKCWNF